MLVITKFTPMQKVSFALQDNGFGVKSACRFFRNNHEDYLQVTRLNHRKGH